MDIRSLARDAARSEHLRSVSDRDPAKGQRSWTPAEKEKVKLFFPDKRSLEKALPHRTWIAIRSHARLLGLRKKQLRWLACDLSRLKRLWTTGTPGRKFALRCRVHDWEQIRCQARGRKFRRPKRKLAPTAHAVIDQIRERASELNLSMGDVDAMAGTKGYFYAARWHRHRGPRLNVHAVGKAILALDGEVIAACH